jgi:hypothetical protein
VTRTHIPQICACGCGETFTPSRFGQKFKSRLHQNRTYCREKYRREVVNNPKKKVSKYRESKPLEPRQCQCTPDCTLIFTPLKTTTQVIAPEHLSIAHSYRMKKVYARRTAGGKDWRAPKRGPLGAIEGKGGRYFNCLSYDDCLEDAQGWETFSCPAKCANYARGEKGEGWVNKVGGGCEDWV